MKVLALTRYGRKGASSRVRFLQYVPYLEAHGCVVTISALLSDQYVDVLYRQKKQAKWEIVKGYFTRILKLLSIKRYDVVWMEKELFPGFPAWVEWLIQKIGVKYIVDYDDAVFHNYDLSKRFIYRSLLRNKIDQVMRFASIVVAGNEYIAARAKAATAPQVQIIPSVVDLNRYQVKKRTKNNPLVVGWMGSPSTVKYLNSIFVALVEVHKQQPFILRVVGANFACNGLNVDCVSWTEDSEVEWIQSFDIGIMPLDDSPWEKGKCGYKLIQYMACGIPVIGSPIGVNCEIVTQDLGFLPATIDAWGHALLALLNDEKMRDVFGEQSRLRVMQRYSLEKNAVIFTESLQRLDI